MKFVSLFVLLLIVIIGCKSGDENAEGSKPKRPEVEFGEPITSHPVVKDTANFTSILWLDSLIDFGIVKEGEKVEMSYKFLNTGEKPLIVANVSAGCGCTIPEYSKEPVMPGKQGFIKAVFNSGAQPPAVHKTITVSTNTFGKQDHTLVFTGQVKTN